MKIILVHLLCVLMIGSIFSIEEMDLMNRVTDYMTQNLKTCRVTLVSVESMNRLSSASEIVIRRIIEVFPCLAVHLEDNEGVRRMLKLRSERTSLKVVLVEVKNELDVVQKLGRTIDFLLRFFAEITRGRCLIFLVRLGETSEISYLLQSFFRLAWRYGFLDISVIELTLDMDEVFLHWFDPFCDSYYREDCNLVENLEIFPRKLDDLNGYTLRTTLFEDIPLVMLNRDYDDDDDIWNAVQGLDIAITMTLAQTLNFTPVLVPAEGSRTTPLIDPDSALNDHLVDFVVNFYGIIGSVSLDKLHFEPSIFLLPFSNHLIIRQRGIYETSVSLDLMVSLALIAVILLILYIFARIVHLDSNLWTAYNLLKILIGNSPRLRSLSPHEKVFHLCVVLVSALLSLQILQRALDIYLVRERFLDLRNLADLLNSGIVPSITRDSKQFLSSSTDDNQVLKELLYRSSEIIDEPGVAKCVVDLIENQQRTSVNGCEVNTVLGKLVATSFSENRRSGWIISFVEEPLQPAWTAMAFARSSPYVDRFDQVLRRFQEAGLTMHWYEETTRNCSFNYKDFAGNRRLYRGEEEDMKHRFVDKGVPLNENLICVLMIGYLVSIIVLVFEVLWNQIRI